MRLRQRTAGAFCQDPVASRIISRTMAEEDRRASISGARSLREMAEFWDTHDAADFDDLTHEVGLTFELGARRHYIAIDPDLLARLRDEAMARGLSAESLANLWLQERLLDGDLKK